jgi:hypothetical protein
MAPRELRSSPDAYVHCNFRHCILPKHRQECLCHTSSPLKQHSRKYSRINVAQTLLSVLVMLGTIEKMNAVSSPIPRHYFRFFGAVAAMYSTTFARNAFAADSSSGSVIVGRSASIIASASLNLPSFALLTAS